MGAFGQPRFQRLQPMGDRINAGRQQNYRGLIRHGRSTMKLSQHRRACPAGQFQRQQDTFVRLAADTINELLKGRQIVEQFQQRRYAHLELSSLSCPLPIGPL